MDFCPIEPKHIPLLRQTVTALDYRSCQLSGASLCYLSGKYRTEIAREKNFLYIRQQRPGLGSVYFMPLGRGDITAAAQDLCAYLQYSGHGSSLTLWGITDEMTDDFARAFPNAALTPLPDWAEYIYECQSLVTLSGKKLHRKRNKLNHFLNGYQGRFRYETLTAAHRDEIAVFQQRVLENRLAHLPPAEHPGLVEENQIIEQGLARYSELGLSGGLLRLDGEVCAFGFGAPVSDTVFDHLCEKADRQYPGAALVLQREMILKSLGDFVYLNKEEDLGLPGLRQSKKALQPHILLMKYQATVPLTPPTP